jgi:hypothetical protein
LTETWVPDPDGISIPKDVAVDSTGAIWVSFQDAGDAFLVKYSK